MFFPHGCHSQAPETSLVAVKQHAFALALMLAITFVYTHGFVRTRARVHACCSRAVVYAYRHIYLFVWAFAVVVFALLCFSCFADRILAYSSISPHASV